MAKSLLKILRCFWKKSFLDRKLSWGDAGTDFRYRPSRFSFTSRRSRRRVVLKNGDCNVAQTNVAKRRRRYLQDIFTTLVDVKWRWTLLVFSLSFILSWLCFAGVWWLITLAHGDLEPGHLPPDQEDSKWTPCVTNIYSFASCFLFSIETQHTIGYGSRFTTEECPEAVFVMCVQSITGVIIQALMVGIVFAKISRPKKRTQTLLFSRNAVISQRDGHLCLQFRVGDMRKSHIIEAHVRAQLIRRRVTREGEVIPYNQHEMHLGGDGADDRIFFIWPTTIVHRIDSGSPLYHMSASDLMREKFELVVILEGVIESTGMTTQARRSYLPNEILWGHRFDNIISFRKDCEQFAVDYSTFHNTSEVDTPLCCQKDLDDIRSMQEEANLGPPSQFCLQVPPSPFGHGSDIFSSGSSDRLSAVSSPSTLRTVDDEGVASATGAAQGHNHPGASGDQAPPPTHFHDPSQVSEPLQTRF